MKTIKKENYLHGKRSNWVRRIRRCSSIDKLKDKDLNNGNHWDSRQKLCKFNTRLIRLGFVLTNR